MISIEQAMAAKATLRERLGRPEWLRGIGVGAGEDGGAVVQVNVAAITPEIRALIPAEVSGVPVRLDEVGDIEKLARS